MRYRPDEIRQDDPHGVMMHAAKYLGGRALIVLGGYSAKGWEALRDEIKPDVIIGANGVNSLVSDLDYWLMCENLTRSNGLAKESDKSAIEIMDMFHRDGGARNKMVSHHSWGLLRDTTNCTKIRRQGLELNEMSDFSFRDYRMGFLAGWLLKHTEAGAKIHVGTVGAQCLHLAGILGCAEVHTIGYDLQFRGNEHHHAYSYPVYKVDRFRTPAAFIDYEGIPTQWAWIETAQWLKAIEWMLDRDGMEWTDHSDGLLSVVGLECTR